MLIPILENNLEFKSFLIDTGSDINLIKYNNFSNKENIKIYTDEILQLKGISGNVSQVTIGYCFLTIYSKRHKFHVVNDKIDIIQDGIIGNQFLKEANAKICYERNQLLFSNIALSIIKGDFNTLTNSDECNANNNENVDENEYEIEIPARSEIFVSIPIKSIENKNNFEGIINKRKLGEGIFLSESLVQIKDNKTVSSILNINNENKIIKINSIDVEPIDSNICEIFSKEYSSSELTTSTIQNFDSNLKNTMSTMNSTSSRSTVALVTTDSIDKLEQINVIKNTAFNNNNSERIELLKSQLRLEHLNKEELESLLNICNEYNDVFYLPGDKLPGTDAFVHKIPVTQDTPISVRQYRYPEIHKAEVNKQVDEMLEKEIIKPSYSPYNFPLWIVPKKLDASGKTKWRLVIDYRKLNDVTIGDKYPIPQIDEILDSLGHSKYFSTLDLASGFNQIKMHPDDSPKTAFSTPKGHFEYLRMPFGLKNAPSTFQRCMDSILSGLQGLHCFIYMDDLVIHAHSLKNHNEKLEEILERLRKFNMRLHPDKCEFLRKECCYLGHIITENGVKPDPKKIDIVQNFPVPKNQKQIKSFLGLIGYYRKFVENFSKIAKPLTELLKKNKEFIWTSLQQNAFEILKNILTTKPLLAYPDFEKEFILTTDASQNAIGAILSQGEIFSDKPIAYASRTLNKAELNYSVTEKEALAIIWAVNYFRHYLYGRKFKIVTDHRPLTWLFNVKDPGSRLIRWRLKLEQYDYEIIYKPGRQNANADCLSRIPINKINYLKEPSYQEFIEYAKNNVIINNNLFETDENLFNIKDNYAHCVSKDFEMSSGIAKQFKQQFNQVDYLKSLNKNITEICELDNKNFKIYYLITKENYWEKPTYENVYLTLQNLKTKLLQNNIKSVTVPKIGCGLDNLKWHKIRTMLRFVFSKTNIKVTISHNRITNPNPNEIEQIIKEYHSTPTGGHKGVTQTYKKLRKSYNWPNMKQNVKSFIQKCDSCQKNKLVRKKTKLPMQITDTSQQAFEKIMLDIVGPLPLTENGNRYILTLQDDLSKFCQAYPIPNQETLTIAKEICSKFICTFGIPEIILTDQGTNFTSELMKDIAKLFQIKKIQTTAYRPQSNGALERSHQTLADYLTHFIKESQDDWDTWIPYSMFSYNTTPHTTTKFTPYELIFGKIAKLPTAITKPPEFHYTYDDYVSELRHKLQISNKVARENILKSKDHSKEIYDRKLNITKFKVGEKVFLLNESKQPGRSKKLTNKYTGPYIIIEENSPVNYTIKVNKKLIKVHANRLKLFHE